MKFKAVIFDLDGTLLDSLAGLAEAMNLLLKKNGFPAHPVERYKQFVGSGIKETVSRALPDEIRGNCDIDKFVVDYRCLYDTIWADKTVPYDGITDLLHGLQKAGIQAAILSNKSDDFCKRMAAALLPGCEFEMTLGDRPGIPRKPHPAAALEIAGSLGKNPAEFIFVGDSGIDMETAVRAGMFPLGVLWGFREAGELLEQGAKKLIHHPRELLNFIGSFHTSSGSLQDNCR